eukprot:4408596-Prymnesium_polylepis.1
MLEHGGEVRSVRREHIGRKLAENLRRHSARLHRRATGKPMTSAVNPRVLELCGDGGGVRREVFGRELAE